MQTIEKVARNQDSAKGPNEVAVVRVREAMDLASLPSLTEMSLATTVEDMCEMLWQREEASRFRSIHPVGLCQSMRKARRRLDRRTT
jgi:hypothetical protein